MAWILDLLGKLRDSDAKTVAIAALMLAGSVATTGLYAIESARAELSVVSEAQAQMEDKAHARDVLLAETALLLAQARKTQEKNAVVIDRLIEKSAVLDYVHGPQSQNPHHSH